MDLTPPPAGEKPRVAVLVGATAVGKTAVALALAQSLGAEIVNADSLQVYRELDIGTAKPSREERARAVHHLIDVADPPEPFDAARFCRGGPGGPGRSAPAGGAAVGGGRHRPLSQGAARGPLCRRATRPRGSGTRLRRELAVPGAARHVCPRLIAPGPGHRRPAPPPRHLPDTSGPWR